MYSALTTLAASLKLWVKIPHWTHSPPIKDEETILSVQLEWIELIELKLSLVKKPTSVPSKCLFAMLRRYPFNIISFWWTGISKQLLKQFSSENKKSFHLLLHKLLFFVFIKIMRKAVNKSKKKFINSQVMNFYCISVIYFDKKFHNFLVFLQPPQSKPRLALE